MKGKVRMEFSLLLSKNLAIFTGACERRLVKPLPSKSSQPCKDADRFSMEWILATVSKHSESVGVDSCIQSARIHTLAAFNSWTNMDYLNLRLKRSEKGRQLPGWVSAQVKIGKLFNGGMHLSPKDVQKTGTKNQPVCARSY